MKIFFSLEGGFAHFPGLAQPREIDTAQLPESDAHALMALLSSSHLLERHAVSPQTIRDARTYTITVIDGDHTQTVQLSDPIGDSALEDLIGLLRQLTQIP